MSLETALNRIRLYTVFFFKFTKLQIVKLVLKYTKKIILPLVKCAECRNTTEGDTACKCVLWQVGVHLFTFK